MTTTYPTRGRFGELTGPREVLDAASAIVALAVKTGKLDAPYIAFDKKGRGSCLNYDAYDLRGSTVLVQARLTLGDKYGMHPTKRYFLLRRAGKGVVRTEVRKDLARKLATAAPELGAAIDALEGKRLLSTRAA
jgi:hypothetical protein